MISIGNLNIQNIYAGSTICKEVFVGPLRIWKHPALEEDPSLPSEYTFTLKYDLFSYLDQDFFKREDLSIAGFVKIYIDDAAPDYVGLQDLLLYYPKGYQFSAPRDSTVRMVLSSAPVGYLINNNSEEYIFTAIRNKTITVNGKPDKLGINLYLDISNMESQVKELLQVANVSNFTITVNAYELSGRELGTATVNTSITKFENILQLPTIEVHNLTAYLEIAVDYEWFNGEGIFTDTSFSSLYLSEMYECNNGLIEGTIQI